VNKKSVITYDKSKTQSAADVVGFNNSFIKDKKEFTYTDVKAKF
jgi:hypothetical protein